MPTSILGWIMRNLLKIIGIIVLLAAILSAPQLITLIQRLSETPRQITATVILERIQALSELSSVRYNFSSIITTTRDVPGILGALYGENQAMVAVGHVRAGIDLSQMKEEDVIRGQDVLLLKLPPPTA
jgi:hypothetical protein